MLGDNMVFDIDSTGVILLCVTGVFFLLQMVYYLVFYVRPLRYQRKKIKENNFPSNGKPPVSVIICSQNESENLKRFLPSVLEQDYPLYEVIVINDGSTDESDEALVNLAKQYKHLYHTYIPEEAKHLSRKKLAMTVGIKAAKYDILLFTEPSCAPIGNQWIGSMSRNFSEDKTIVLGFSPFSKGIGLKGKFAAYDSLVRGLQYLSLALFNCPYSGSGRNMAYNKSHFFDRKGYSKFMHLHAGEDDLFINQIATPENTSVEISKESLVQAHPDGFRMWKEARLCRSTTQKYYRWGPVTFWRFETYSKILCWIAMICLFIHGWPQPLLPAIASGLFLIRFLTQLLVVNKACKLLQVEHFYFTLFLFDFFQPFFDIYITVSRLTRGKKDYIWRY